MSQRHPSVERVTSKLDECGDWLNSQPGILGFCQREGIVVYADASLSDETRKEVKERLGNTFQQFETLDHPPRAL